MPNKLVKSVQPGIIVSHHANPEFMFHFGEDPISVPEEIAIWLTTRSPGRFIIISDKKPIKPKRSRKKKMESELT